VDKKSNLKSCYLMIRWEPIELEAFIQLLNYGKNLPLCA